MAHRYLRSCTAVMANSGVIQHFRAVTAEASGDRPHNESSARRVLMRVMAVRACDAAAALPPAFRILERGDLIGNQKIVRQGIFDYAEAGMALRTWLHLIGDGKARRIADSKIRRMSGESYQMLPAGTVAIFARNA